MWKWRYEKACFMRMKRQRIVIDNLLPDGISFEVYQEPDEVKAMLEKEGFGEMAQQFLTSVLDDMRKDPLAHWHRWEGYFRDLGKAQHLVALGAAFFNGTIYVRGMLCREVPEAKVEETEKALGNMMDEYLTKLRSQNLESQSNN
jgi:hypothetical protein